MSASPRPVPRAPAPFPAPRPPPAARPLAHSGFAAQSLTFRTGVRSHVLADSPHLPSTASSASSSSSSSLPTSTRRLTLEPGEGTHNQVGLRTGALGGLPLGQGQRGRGRGLRFLLRASLGVRARPATGVREKARERRGLRARRRVRPAARACLPAPSPPPRRSQPPRCAEGEGARGARGAPRPEQANWRARGRARGGGDVAAVFCSAGRAGCVCTSRRGLGGREGGKGGFRGLAERTSFVWVAGGDSQRASENLPAGLFLNNWPVGNKGWASRPTSMKGAMKHGFLQLAARTSL